MFMISDKFRFSINVRTSKSAVAMMCITIT